MTSSNNQHSQRYKTMAERDAEYHTTPRPYAFVPAEMMFSYPKAAAVISAAIPRIPRVKMENRNAVGIDSEWLQSLVEMANERDLIALLSRISLADSAFSLYGNHTWLSDYIGGPMTTSAICGMNADLYKHDMERKANGMPTFEEIWRHMLGVERNLTLENMR
jgi:hypothetical protein